MDDEERQVNALLYAMGEQAEGVLAVCPCQRLRERTMMRWW